MTAIRVCLRWLLSMLLVSLPVSYLIWSWETNRDPTLTHLSYQGFRTEFLGGAPASFRTFALWVLLVFMFVNIATAIVSRLFAKVFPDRAVKLEDLKRK